ncbi:HAD family hydrolase [Halorussus litoreus]|uniref:HAD family hydrolase n=1 Tax=Halorussus litoreus TaxID=1710536 RepID=UPI000E25C1E6|nr:HAD family hydrolase [Halorussus litoreus]
MTTADISTVFLDLDDTICRHPRSTADRLADAFNAAGVNPFFDVTDFRRWLAQVSADTRLELREKCFARIADEQGRDPADALAVARTYEDPDPTSVEFLPGAESALDRLGATHDLALVTNGGRETQTAKLEALDIADHFGALTFAGSDHAVKPDPQPFEYTLSAMGVSADETVHVGNSLRADVAGAHAAGLQSVWLEEREMAGAHDPHHTIASMHDLHEPPWM